jgi:hypothetical protein
VCSSSNHSPGDAIFGAAINAIVQIVDLLLEIRKTQLHLKAANHQSTANDGVDSSKADGGFNLIDDSTAPRVDSDLAKKNQVVSGAVATLEQY